jgi:hypothetical protein
MSHVLSRELFSRKQGTCEAWRGPDEIVFAISTGIVADRYVDGRLYAGPLYRRQILQGAFDLIAK